jgi:triosephosphate isomerase
MNKGVSETIVLIGELAPQVAADIARGVEVAVCPPFISLAVARDMLSGTGLKLGAQNAHPEAKGAFTGEVSVSMLAGLVDFVIVGHSERRQIFGETDAFVNKKALAVLAAGLTPIICIGETLAENEAGQTEAVLSRQTAAALQGIQAADLPRIVIAYEPIWAIGTGRAATPADAQNRCAFVRAEVRKAAGAAADVIRIQYGGSVTAANAKEILGQPDIAIGEVGCRQRPHEYRCIGLVAQHRPEVRDGARRIAARQRNVGPRRGSARSVLAACPRPCARSPGRCPRPAPDADATHRTGPRRVADPDCLARTQPAP